VRSFGDATGLWADDVRPSARTPPSPPEPERPFRPIPQVGPPWRSFHEVMAAADAEEARAMTTAPVPTPAEIFRRARAHGFERAWRRVLAVTPAEVRTVLFRALL